MCLTPAVYKPELVFKRGKERTVWKIMEKYPSGLASPIYPGKRRFKAGVLRDGILRSNRQTTMLTDWEIEARSVVKGIHVFLNHNLAKSTAKSWGQKYVVIPCIAQREHYIAHCMWDSKLAQAAFTQIQFNMQARKEVQH
jgi:hypothetical protein